MTEARDEPPVSLDDYCAALRRRLGSERHFRSDWVLCDEHRHVQRAYAADYQRARVDLHALFGEDRANLERFELFLIIDGRIKSVDWPRSGTPVERARSYVRGLNNRAALDDAQLAAIALQHFLRPEILALAGARSRRAVELTWMTVERPSIRVGVAVEEEPGAFCLYEDQAAARYARGEVFERIAEAVEDATGCHCDGEMVQAVRENTVDAPAVPDSTASLIRFGCDVAGRFKLFARWPGA